MRPRHARGSASDRRSVSSSRLLGSLSRGWWWEGLRFHDAQVGADPSGPAILELDLGLNGAALPVRIQGVDQHIVFFTDKATTNFAGTGELTVVRIECLVEDEKSV